MLYTMKRNKSNWLISTSVWAYYLITLIAGETCRVKEIPKELWYLERMNVLSAWRDCVNGTGVTVAVVDTGVQDHYDLNVDRSLDGGEFNTSQNDRLDESLSHLRNLFRPQRNPDDILKHGTRVAGIIAAKGNDQGPIGIAFGSSIADIRLATTGVFDTFNASLLNHLYNDIDVYSCSFANFHTGTKTYPLLPSQKRALEVGTTKGRGGLGSVYVFATGNHGGKDEDIFRDSCAYDRLVTNRYVISVAGIKANLGRVPSGEACSAMMVSAFTSEAGGGRPLFTTDIGNSTTTSFNLNSAAVPMVSGAVALALSANPSLTYRDIMHLLVTTSRSDLPNENYTRVFKRNGAGINVSSIFGFGLLDIGRLVDIGKTWKTVPSLQICKEEKIFNVMLHNNSRSNQFIIHVRDCAVGYIEHVEVTLKLHHPNAGQLRWLLFSPYGTKSVMLPGRALDPTTDMDITVLTVQMWGENPNGFWKLKPKSTFGKSIGNGILNSAELTIYGTTCGILQCLLPAKQDIITNSKWSPWGPCTVSCGQGEQYRYRKCHTNRHVICVDSVEKKSCVMAECPSEKVNFQNNTCPPPEMLKSVCAEQCSTDSECEETMKCCYNGCGHTCEKQKFQRNTCPAPEMLESICAEQCSSDTECGETMKCCYNGCGHTCEKLTEIPEATTTLTTEQKKPNMAPNLTTGPSNWSWNSWSSWSPCSNTCGQGTKTRTRSCRDGICFGDISETTPCNDRNCPGIWSAWTSWSQCSTSCGQGWKTRLRQCRGGNCVEAYYDMMSCNNGKCPCIDTSGYCLFVFCPKDYCRRSCGLC